ncbi:SH3 domain-containing protein [Arthrobacter sp.]|uniref:SH3 domain-containing protein n=1 Tax=Arthrobacter sp. TaxID=1667 RepID=UPI003A8DACE7
MGPWGYTFSRGRGNDGTGIDEMGRRLRRGAGVVLSLVLLGAPVIPAHAVEMAVVAAPQQGTLTSSGVPQMSSASPVAAGLSVARATTAKTVRTTANVHLRTGAATKHRSLAVLKKGTVVVPTGKKSGQWWRVKAAGKTGWASSKYLKTTTKTTAPKTVYRYMTKYTILQKSASTSSTAVTGIQRRTRVQYLGSSGAWRQVKVNTKTGYVPAASLSDKNPAPVYRWAKSSMAGFATIRAGAKKTATFSKDTKVEWFRSTSGWDYVKSSSGAGWVSSAGLKKKPVSILKPKAYRWATSKVNVRTGDGTKHRSLGTINAWSKVEYLATRSGWSNVKTTRGTGWIKNTYLSTHDRYDVAVYGTLRHGQSAYFLIKGKTSSEKRTTVVGHNLYLRRDKTWWSYMVPGTQTGQVVVERMKFKPSLHTATLRNMDSWERFDPKKPLDNQNYNRKLVTDASGAKVWAYVASKKMATYMKKSGIPVASGDYLKRY